MADSRSSRARRRGPRGGRAHAGRRRALQPLRRLGRAARSSSRPTWTRCRRSSPRRRTPSTSRDAAPATPRAAIAAMLQALEGLLAEGAAASGCSSSSARRPTAPAPPAANRDAAGRPLPDQRRADREPPGPGLEGRALPGARGGGPDRPLGLSGARRLGDRAASWPPWPRLRAVPLPSPIRCSGETTLNIGTSTGGRAANVVRRPRRGPR